MLKTAREATPELTDENYVVWKDKMQGILSMQGLLKAVNIRKRAMFEDDHMEIQMLLM